MMSELEFEKRDIAVALILDEQERMLWTWNGPWSAFALPMTRRRVGAGIVEPADQAAARAGAEALGVPVQVGQHWKTIPDLKVSGRDFQVRQYTYDLHRVEPHPDFANALDIRRPHLWLSADQARSGAYRPLSQSCLDILTILAETGRLPRRIRPAGDS
jgi:hypothetical protein